MVYTEVQEIISGLLGRYFLTFLQCQIDHTLSPYIQTYFPILVGHHNDALYCQHYDVVSCTILKRNLFDNRCYGVYFRNIHWIECNLKKEVWIWIWLATVIKSCEARSAFQNIWFDYKTTYGSYLCELYNIAYYKLYLHLGKIL